MTLFDVDVVSVSVTLSDSVYNICLADECVNELFKFYNFCDAKETKQK